MEFVALAALRPHFQSGLGRSGGFGPLATRVAGWSGIPMLSDGNNDDPARLIAAIAINHDRRAFASLFSFYAPRIKGFLTRTGTPAEVAEEIAQEAMLSVWRKAAMFDVARASASTWIYTIARNLRIDRVRHDRGVSADALYDVLGGDDPERPDDLLEGTERDDHIRVAMKELSSEQRTVVQLSFFEDKAHGEIARILGIPLGTVKSRLRLAMARLRERLDEVS
jgi:RNA polymerase sigma-70 factor (ECF subfamily)